VFEEVWSAMVGLGLVIRDIRDKGVSIETLGRRKGKRTIGEVVDERFKLCEPRQEVVGAL
jgi:hypothetical protein